MPMHTYAYERMRIRMQTQPRQRKQRANAALASAAQRKMLRSASQHTAHTITARRCATRWSPTQPANAKQRIAAQREDCLGLVLFRLSFASVRFGMRSVTEFITH